MPSSLAGSLIQVKENGLKRVEPVGKSRAANTSNNIRCKLPVSPAKWRLIKWGVSLNHGFP
jgi:hypothetical protein